MLNTALVDKLETIEPLSHTWRTGAIKVGETAPGDYEFSTSVLSLCYALAPVSKRHQSGHLHSYEIGTGWVVPAGLNIRCGYETTARNLTVQFPLSTLRDVLPETKEMPNIPMSIVEDPTVLQMTLNIYQASLEDDAYSALYCDTMTLALAAHLYRSYGELEEIIPQTNDPRIKRAIDYIEDNLNQPITLDELAGVAAMSRYHFAKMFKDLTSRPPHRYLAERRIEQAQSLLMSSSLSITEVAYQVGYNSQSNFTQIFRRLTGLTPAKYREVRA